MKYDTQFWNGTNKQHFMWDDSSELNNESDGGTGPVGPHIKNQLAITNDTI